MKKLLLFLAAAFCINIQAQVITTIAGVGPIRGNDVSAVGGLADTTKLSHPASIITDAAGNMYMSVSNLVRKINTAGIISAYAGTGLGTFTSSVQDSGDGGQATAAQLSFPNGLAFDAAGNLYIADSYNHKIRVVNTAGIINTFAGNGTQGYAGDGGPATAALLDAPWGIAVDAMGNVFFSDINKNVVRKINTAGIISTVAGNGTSTSSGNGGQATAAGIATTGIAFDASGNLYIGDGFSAIRMVNSMGIISTIAGTGTDGYSGDGGPATSAKLHIPFGLTFDRHGNLYFTDSQNYCVRKIDNSGIISTVAGNGIGGFSGDGGAATAAQLSHLVSNIAFDASGNLLIPDNDNNCVRQVTMCSTPAVSYTLTNVSPQTWNAYPSYSSNIISAKWYWGDGTSTTGLYPSHTYSVAGRYNICVTAFVSCGDSSQSCQNDSVYRYSNNSTLSNMVYVNVLNNTTAGINQLAANNTINIYPNPAQTNFTVETNTSEKQMIFIFDVNGKLVFNQFIYGKTTIDAGNLNAGVYSLNITSNQGTLTKKLVIVK